MAASNTITNLHTPHKPVTRFSVKPAFSRLAAWEGVRNQKRFIAKGGIIQMMHKFNNGLENASSGRHALKKRLQQPGYFFVRKDDIFWRFKSVAEKTEPVLGEDILDALVVDELCQPDSIWSLRDLQVTCGTLGLSTSTVRLIDADGKEHVACSVGTGPVDSAYKAIDRIVKVPATLLEYSLTTVTKGIEAIATTRVMVSGDDCIKSTHASGDISCHQTFSGSGSEEDIVISSVRAYLSALNKMLSYQNKPNNLKASDKIFDVSASAAAPAASI